MNILLTGAGGLVGTHLLPKLHHNNHTVYTISRSLKGDKNVFIDLSEEWDSNLLPANIDCIIHLAQSENFRDFPGKANDVFYTNTVSTLKLADWAQRNGVKKFIYASSAGIYGNSDSAFKEDQQIVYQPALGFYLGTKHCSEVILENYSALLDVIMLRFFFVYGKGQRNDMLIPRLIDNIKSNTSITLQGNDGIKINPIHADDAADAIINCLQLEGSNTFNIGGNEVLTLRQICETIGREVNVSPIFAIQEQEPKHIFGDISKMTQYLGAPKVSFSEGIKKFS